MLSTRKSRLATGTITAILLAGLGLAQAPMASANVTALSIANTPQDVVVDGTTAMQPTTVTPTGTPVTTQYRGAVTQWATSGLTSPSGIVRDDSLYYVLNDRMGTPSIKVLDDTGTVLRTLSLPGSITGKVGASLQMDDSGSLYIAELRDPGSGTWSYDDTIYQLLGARAASASATLTLGATINASPTPNFCTDNDPTGIAGAAFFTVSSEGRIYAFSKALNGMGGCPGEPVTTAGTVWQVDVGGTTSGTLTGAQVMDQASGSWLNDTVYWTTTNTGNSFPYAAVTQDDTLWVAGGRGELYAVPLDPATGTPGVASLFAEPVTSPGLIVTTNTGQQPVGGMTLDPAGERLYFNFGNSVRMVRTDETPGTATIGLAAPAPTQVNQYSGNAIGAPWVARFDTWGNGSPVVNGDPTSPEFGAVRMVDSTNNEVKQVEVLGYSLAPVNSDDITPTLITDDTGLGFNSNGSISGTASTTIIPTLTTANYIRNYTVTYTNLDGSSTDGAVQLTLGVAPTSYKYRAVQDIFGSLAWKFFQAWESPVFPLGSQIPLWCPSTETSNLFISPAVTTQACTDPNLLSVGIGLGIPQANSYTVSPPFPVGIQLNASTGAITGAALDDSAMTTYTITAANALGSTTSTIEFAAVLGAPTGTVAVPGDGSAAVVFTAPALGPLQPVSYTVSASPGGATCTVAAPATTCVVTGLTNGTAYTFTSVANYAGGLASAPSTASTAVTPTATPLAPFDPSVSAVAGNASATVYVGPATGGPPSGAPTSYAISASPGGATCTVTVPATSCTLTGLTNGTSYTISATATNGTGTSAASTTSVTPGLPGTPLAPTALVSASGTALVSVAPGPGVAPTSYTVTASPGGATCTVTPPAGSCTISGLSNGTAYTFTSTATGPGGTSGSSSMSSPMTASATVPAPGQPGFPTAVGGASQATVTVTPPSSGGAPSSYAVTAAPGGATCTVTSPALSCTVSGLTNGTPYTFTATATNTAGTSTSSPSSNSVTPGSSPSPGPGPNPGPTPVAPSAPTSVSVTSGANSATVTWSAPANPGSFAVTQYRVVASPGGASCLVPASTTSCTLTGLTNGTTYTVSVSALSGAGWGASATSAPFTPGNSAPATPAVSGVLAGNGSATVTVAAGSGGGPVTSYLVTASPGGATCTVTAPASSCVVTGLTNGTAYTFTATATGPGGTSPASAASSSVTPVAPITPTPAPLPAPLAPGQANLQQGGQVVPGVSVTPNQASTGLNVTGPGFTMSLQGENADGRPLSLDPDGVLVLEEDRTLRTSGTGFFPGSQVDLYADPLVLGNGSMLRVGAGATYLGTVSVDSLGDFDGTVTVDPSLGVGDHVVQAIGVTQSNQERAMSLGVRIKEQQASRPGPVRDLKLVSKTSTTVKVSWLVPADDGGSPITKYKVRHRLKGEEKYQGRLTVTGLSATVKGLTPGKTYYIRVKAVNDVGTGPSDTFVKVRLPKK